MEYDPTPSGAKRIIKRWVRELVEQDMAEYVAKQGIEMEKEARKKEAQAAKAKKDTAAKHKKKIKKVAPDQAPRTNYSGAFAP